MAVTQRREAAEQHLSLLDFFHRLTQTSTFPPWCSLAHPSCTHVEAEEEYSSTR